jgi:radical SAM protein with 4Fe4S-binding SPASM domain
MDKANFEDLMHLSDQLAARFPNRENLNVYVSLLRDFGHPVNCISNVEEQLCAFRAMKEKLTESGLYKKRYLEKKIKSNRCMADNDYNITILPDGRIGKCEHESEQALIGSIYGEKLDQEKIAAWKEHVNVPACRKCPVYPLCNDLNMCPWFNGDCSELNRRMQI